MPSSFSLRALYAVRDTVRAWNHIFYLSAQMGVLVLSPSTYSRIFFQPVLRRIYKDTAPILLGFSALIALVYLVITHVLIDVASSYGLSVYVLEAIIRVLVLEIIPLTATLFVAMRCTIPNATKLALMRFSGEWSQRIQAGEPVLRMEIFPRVISGLYACVTLVALSFVVALLTAYIGVHGMTTAGFQSYTRMFGNIFTPAVTLVFAMKTFFFSLAVALIPVATGLYGKITDQPMQPGSELSGLVRMFAVLLLIELTSLAGNYY